VKRIVVKPGERLSLQMHLHRAEHWAVVRGTALVTRGEERFMLAENQSTFIPPGVTHRIGEPGKAPLVVVEVQSGAYPGEDDIVRFDDKYGRMSSITWRIPPVRNREHLKIRQFRSATCVFALCRFGNTGTLVAQA
jgi:oxalate decarboxylase/phosphoglucose isomerase-like protein (cupin superfamily)